MNPPAVYALASNTFKESIRNRVLHALIGATVAVSGLSYVLAWITGDEAARRARVISNLSLSAIALLGALCAIFLGTNLIYLEIERRTVYTILARPVSRAEFILGKFFGLSAVVTAAVAVMGAGFLAFAWVYARIDGRDAGLGLAHLIAIGFTAVELIVVVAVAILFSSIAHPIEGAVFSFVVVFAGHFTESLDRFGQSLLSTQGGHVPTTLDRIGAQVLHVVYVLFPDLDKLVFRDVAANGTPLDGKRVLFGLLYALVYTALLLVLAVAGFRRKTL